MYKNYSNFELRFCAKVWLETVITTHILRPLSSAYKIICSFSERHRHSFHTEKCAYDQKQFFVVVDKSLEGFRKTCFKRPLSVVKKDPFLPYTFHAFPSVETL